MKQLIITGFMLPIAEIVLGCLWLAGGHDAAGRVLTFYWWLYVALLFSISMFFILAHLVANYSAADMKPSTPATRFWLRAVFFARVIAQVAIGCTSLAVFSLTSWLFCRMTVLIVADGQKKAAGA